jgi:hypothetical protein
MFAYSDPTGTGFLQSAGVLQNYREKVHFFDRRFHTVPNSGFALREAFEQLAPGTRAEITTVRWSAFPVTAAAGAEEIDNGRLDFQDEYCEWRVEKNGETLTRVTFTTEFSEYLEAFAEVGVTPLKEEIGRLVPAANPTDADLFGPGFNPATMSAPARGDRFRRNLPNNPWNNGQRGILCLTQQFNTMSALFNLLGACGVPRPDLDSGAVCANVGGACGPGRHPHPNPCRGVQDLARNDRSFSLQDPAGIRIMGLDPAGRWTVKGQAVDMNNEAVNSGIWKVTRNGRRGTFTFQGDVRLGGARINTGADLARQLIVGAAVIHAPNAALPEWARIGNEGLRGPNS